MVGRGILGKRPCTYGLRAGRWRVCSFSHKKEHILVRNFAARTAKWWPRDRRACITFTQHSSPAVQQHLGKTTLFSISSLTTRCCCSLLLSPPNALRDTLRGEDSCIIGCSCSCSRVCQVATRLLPRHLVLPR